ncbi:hypothetical protein ES703_46509 [subsurface metagenome]
MPKEFNPLVDIATFMVSIAKALPPLPPPPEAPKPPPVETPRNPLISYVEVEDSLVKASTEHFRAEQKAKGLVPFVYE